MSQQGQPASAPPAVQPIIELAITSLPTHSNSEFQRFATIANPAYLWCRRGDAEPVTEVKVVYGGGAAEAGWVKVAEDLNSSSTNSGPSKRVHIWYRKGGDGSPIIDLKVATSNDVVIGPGFARLEEVLNPDADKNTAKEFLCFKTKASQAKLDAAEYKEGDEVDAKDTANNWCVARIMAVDGDKVLVHYKGWSEKWDEWMDRKSKRIAPFRSKTMGRATGWEGDKEAFLLKEKEKEFNEIDKRSEELETKMDSKDFKEFTKDEVMYLSAQQNYAYVLNCLNAIVDDPDLLPRVHNFLQRQLKFVIRFLVHEPEIPGQILESLVKIFSGDHQYRRFYTKYGVKGTEKDVGGKFAVRAAPPQNPADDKVVIVSSYLIALINWFGDNGGFEAITDRLTNDKWQDSFFNVALILKALGASKGNWNPKFGPKFVATLDLQKLLPARLRKITDLELKTLTKDGIVEMVRDVEGLMTLSLKAQTIAEIMEKVSLDMSLRLLTAKVLEKRLNGCVELEETIKRVWRKERAPYVAHGQAAGGQGQGQSQEVAPAKYLTSKMLVEWIEENKVVEIFLGANSHEQIIKRSPMLLKFLASNNALTVNHVDLLWSSSIDKHEGLVRIVYDTLADLAQELADEQLDALYKRITVVNFTEYTDFVLNFIKNFTINAVKATAGKNKWYGLDLFWKIIQDDVKVTNQIANQASATLKELLEQPQFEAQRLVYLDSCLLGVRESKSVVQCLRLAKVIISMFPVQSHNKQVYSMEELLVAMEERQQVLGLLLNDLIRYNTTTKKLLAGPEGKSADQKDPVFFGRHPHSLQIATRLDFLDFVLSHSPLQLNQQAIDVLWENFVTGGVLPDDKGYLLDWFNQAVNDEGRRQFPIFSDEVAKYLFTNLLCNAQKLDFASLSKKGYECFETYFININYAAQCLLTTSRKYMAVTDYAKLVGMDALWQIASWAADPDVAASAKKFLATCHIRLDFKFTPAEKKQIFKSFVDRTMAGLTEASKAIQASRDQERMKRQANALLDLLENFLTRCENGETIEKPRFSEGENVRATWKGGARIYEAKIMAVNREGTYVVRYSDGDMDKNCPESSIMPLADKPEEKKKPDDDTQLYPKFILSNEKKYFDLLFELLEVGGELGPKVWKLLERLPTNQDLSARIKQLNVKDSAGKIAWDTLLPSKSVIKLLYSMQIIDQNVQVPDNNEPAKKEMAEWCNIFVTQGGFAHMYRILATVDEKQMIGEPLPQQCLNFLIKLSNFFLSGSSGLDASLAHAAVEHSKLMGKLMSVMAALSEAKSEEVKKPTKKVQVSEERESRQPLIGPMRPPPPLPPDAAGSEGQPGGADAAAAANQAAAAAPDDNLSQMVTNTCNLITSVAGPKHDSLEAVYKFAGWKDIITNGLLRNGNPAFRTRLANGIHVICSKFNKLENPKPPRVHFLSVLLACLPNLDTQSGAASNSNDYFQLVQTLLKGSKTEDGSFDPQSLSLHLSEKIKTHPVVERRVEDTDVVLCGLFMLAQVLLSKVPALKEPLGSKHGLMEDIYHCLFDVPSTTSRGKRDAPPPKCKSPRSRKLAFALMVELAKECPANSKALIALLVQNHLVSHSGGTHPEDWNFEAKTEEKSDAGYVGLKNLGCICYMNALMQQLFMIPKLRSNLLAVDLEKEEDKKESVLYQLQYIFALLQESEKMYANPEGFCYAFKDFDGKPTNVSIQEDAAGFYSRLLDKIDEQVKTTEWRDCVKEVLGGTLSHELIGQRGCTHYKEREETFYTVTLQVQNKKNMQESLQAFVQGEMLEGENAYKCGQCGKKVDTLKRTCLKALPPTIAFVLKRFALDYNTMQTTKLNDRLEFPMVVDLKPFCKESLPAGNANEAKDAPAAGPEGKGAATGDGKTADKPVNRPDDYYKYELKGICVHTGGASHGHYYSFIRERLIGDDPEADAGGRWYEFNDTIVRPFDPKDIPNECFGGAESRRSMGQYSGMGNPANTVQGPTIMHEKSRSAYVLFYDRVKPKKVAETPAVVSDSKLSLAGAAASVLFHNKMKKINEGQRALARVHPKIFNQIWGQNLTYWRDKAVFDHGYFEFLQDLILGDEKEKLKDGDDSSAVTPAQVVAKHSGPVKAEASDSVKLATYFVFNTLSRAFHKNALGSWMSALRRMYSSVPACAWLLETMTSTTWNFEFLLGCNDPDVRQQVSALICQALSTLSPLEQGSYDQPLPAKASPVPETKEGKEKETKEKAPAAGTTSEVKDDRGYVVKYIDSAVRFLRSAPEHWKSFEPLFRVLSHFASLGIKEARYIGDKHNFVAKLIDFYLGDESPMPQVGEMATDANGKRRVMGDNWQSPDFTYVLQLLRTLICSFGTDTFGKDKPQLPQTARELLLSKQFLPRLLQDATSRKRGKSVSDVVAHWCTENEKLSQTIVATIAMGIENNSYDAARAYFRVLMTLVQLKDSVQPKRVEWILQSLLSVMSNQQKYWKITDFCIEHLIRMAKKSDDCYRWLHSHPQQFEWIFSWIKTNPKPPRGFDQNEATQLHKPGKGPSEQQMMQQMSQWNVQGHMAYPTHVGLPPAKKLQALQLIKDGTPLDRDEASDSDVDLADREFEVGQWVDALDTANKWLCAQIVDVTQGKIRVHYDGWSEKWNAWFDKSSIKVQTLGKHSTKGQLKARGKKQKAKEGQTQASGA